MYQLNGSHVFFPPQILLEAWSSCSEAVVEIHDDMDSRVHHGMERPHSTFGNDDKNKLTQANVNKERLVFARKIKKAEDI